MLVGITNEISKKYAYKCDVDCSKHKLNKENLKLYIFMGRGDSGNFLPSFLQNLATAGVPAGALRGGGHRDKNWYHEW